MSIAGRSVLTVIPARGGSKGIPRKNLAPFLGKPLVVHSIELAKKLRYSDRTIVSTEDAEITAVSQAAGAEVVHRPPELAGDLSSMAEVLRDLVERSEFRAFDLIVLLQPTSPLRRLETVERAIEEFNGSAPEFTSLMPLRPIEPKIGAIENERYVPLFTVGAQRQELRQLYAECGTVFLYRANAIRGNRIFERIYPFIVNGPESLVDIDCEEDLRLAEAVASCGWAT